MIDEARLVAADAGVDYGVPIDDEQKCMIVTELLVLVAPIGLAVRDSLAQVLDDARAAPYAPARKHPTAMHRGAPHRQQTGAPRGQ